MLDTLSSIYMWLKSDGIIYLSAALAVSEALASIPALKANSIFQAVMGGLKWVADKLIKKD